MVGQHYYTIYKFSDIDSAVKFMNENNIPDELVTSLTPTKYTNISSYSEVAEWTLVINKTSYLPFFK